MALNFPGPYEMRVFYNTDGIGHVGKLNCSLNSDPGPGLGFALYDLNLKGGGTDDAANAVEVWLSLWNERLSMTDSTVNRVELWKYVPDTFDAQFYAVYSPMSQPFSGAAYTPARQEILTFRTLEGGILRINLMEPAGTGQIQTDYPTGNTSIDDMFDYVVSASSWILARDTSYAMAPLRWSQGQNEKTFRQRYR